VEDKGLDFFGEYLNIAEWSGRVAGWGERKRGRRERLEFLEKRRKKVSRNNKIA
jgi:hypothetical protein